MIVFGEYDGCLPFSRLLKSASNVKLAEIDPYNDVALIPYSSGTTGLPKGVQLTHRNIVADLVAMG